MSVPVEEGDGGRSTRSVKSMEQSNRATLEKVNSPQKLTMSAVSEDIIALRGCGSGSGEGDTRSGIDGITCRKIVCLTDMPSNGFREVRIKMYLFRKVIGSYKTTIILLNELYLTEKCGVVIHPDCRDTKLNLCT